MTDAPAPTGYRRGPAFARHGMIWTAVVAVIVLAVWGGLGVRRWTWDATEAVHFHWDIERGYGWGVAGSGEEGYLNLYDKLANQKADWQLFIDYAPLRLAVMTLWAGHNRHTLTDFDRWHRRYDFNAPVLWFNTAMELAGVLAAFFLVRKVVLDARRPLPSRSWAGEWSDRLRRRPASADAGRSLAPPHRPFAGWATALVAALLVWFNPVLILSAHGWPTWDMWIVPIYLLALLAAAYDRWLLSGAVLAVGVMFKGQQLVTLPVFLAWPLLLGRWRAFLCWCCGFAIAFAAIAAPWLLTRIPADVLLALRAAQDRAGDSTRFGPFVAVRAWNGIVVAWTLGVFAAAAGLPFAVRRRERWTYAAWAVAAAAVLWPLVRRHDAMAVGIIGLGLGGVTLGATFVARRRDRVVFAATAAAFALLAAVPLLGASRAWWDCGIAYGTYHYPSMVMGFTDNLAGLLAERFDWHDIHEVVFTFRPPAWTHGAATPVEMVTLLRTLFVVAMLPFLWAVPRHARRHDPKWLVAVVGPWLAFFCFPAQIHERYLLYAAALGCLWAGQSLGMTLLAVVLTGIAWMQTLHCMLEGAGPANRIAFGDFLHRWRPEWFSQASGVTAHRLLWHTFPDAAWAVLLAYFVVLYVALRSGRPKEMAVVDPDFGRHGEDAAVQEEDALVRARRRQYGPTASGPLSRVPTGEG